MVNSILPTEYPEFVANQVLTNEQLNQLRNFLDSHNRLTRIRLIGTGIVCGLEVRVTTNAGNAEITITEGVGVTSDGYLIQIPETTFSHVRTYIDPDIDENDNPNYCAWQATATDETQISLEELLTQKEVTDNDLENHPTNPAGNYTQSSLDDKVLMLYLEKGSTNLKSCFTTDCNNKGKLINLNIVAVLANKQIDTVPVHGDVERFKPDNDCQKELSQLHSPRFYAGVKFNLGTNANLSSITNAADIQNAYRVICNHMKSELATAMGNIYSSYGSFLGLWEFENAINDLESDLDNRLNGATLLQYHYDFLKDLIQTHNELNQMICELVEPCCPKDNFPEHFCSPSFFRQHLVLRDFTNATPRYTEGYRHPFYPSPVKNVMHRDLERIKLLFRRVLVLVEHFSVPEKAIKDITITPSQRESYPLGDRAIPYYYDKDEVASFWPPEVCCELPALGYVKDAMDSPAAPNFADFLEKPLHYNLNPYAFFRIEGHLNLDYNEVLKKLQAIRLNHNLEFSLKALSLSAAPDPQANQAIISIQKTYEEIQDYWKKIYTEIEQGDFNYKDELDLIRGLQQDIIDLSENWGEEQGLVAFPCDISAFQTDYLALRTELLCLLNKCKPTFTNFPEINVGGPPATEQEACVTFENMEVGSTFGEDSDDTAGQVIHEESQIRLSLENFRTLFGNQEAFNEATIESDTIGGRRMSLNRIGLRFDFSQLPFTVTEVSMPFIGELRNIGANGTVIRGFVNNNFNGQTIPGITFSYSIDNPGGAQQRGILTFRGQNIQNVQVGGRRLSVDNVCARGQSENANIRQEFFDSRLSRIQQICTLLESTLFKDLRCFNFSLLQVALKDLSGAAIELKLLLGFVFRRAQGYFQAYATYPEWNDIENCLDALHSTCLHARFSTFYHTFRAAVEQGYCQFQEFVEEHPGIEHLAGVPKGGTFLVVYESEDDPEIVADFALEHYLEECCGCKIDVQDICLPPVALSDYYFVNIPADGQELSIQLPVRLNDFGQNIADDISFGPLNASTDRGASVTANEEGRHILYQSQNAIFGVDHFTYTVRDNECEKEDTGHVYVLLQPFDFVPPEGPGRLTGTVRETDKPLVLLAGATVDIFDDAGNIVDTTTTNELGRFRINELAEADYTILVRHPHCYNTYRENFRINADQETDLATIELTPSIPNPRFCSPEKIELITGEDQVLETGRCYLLDRLVYLNKATLEIQAGAIILAGGTDQGVPPAGLVVTRSGSIIANGTREQPIIFTSVKDQGNLTEKERGLWGGIFILGSVHQDPNAGPQVLPGFPPTDERNFYGGSNEDRDDVKRQLSYVSIRHAGASYGLEKQMASGLTLAGVGNLGDLMTFDHIEVFASAGSGISFYSGNINTRHLVSAFNSGLAYHMNNGYTGENQFWFAIHSMESSEIIQATILVEDSDEKANPIPTTPRIYNSTLIGPGIENIRTEQEIALHFRFGGWGTFANSIVVDYPLQGIEVENKLNQLDSDSYGRLVAGGNRPENPGIFNNIWFRIDSVQEPKELVRPTFGEDTDIDAVIRHLEEFNNIITDPLLCISNADNEYPAAHLPQNLLDPRLADDAAGGVIQPIAIQPESNFLREVEYIGAFSKNEPLWLKCWTRLDELKYLPGESNDEQPFTDIGLVQDRLNARVGTIQNQTAIADASIYASTLNYVQKGTNNGLASLESLGNRLMQLTQDIIIAFDKSDTQTDQLQYQRILKAASHSYFDRVVLQDPNKLNPTAAELIPNLVRLLEESDLAPNTLRSNWKHAQLKKSVGSKQTIDTIQNLLKNND